MNYITLKKNLLRLYHSYIKKYFDKLILSLLLSLVVAGSTAAIAWLLDPAIEKMFIEQDKTMMASFEALKAASSSGVQRNGCRGERKGRKGAIMSRNCA